MEHEEVLKSGKMRDMRKKAHLTQEALAEAVDCSTRWYQSVEAGTGRPSAELTERIIKVLAESEGSAL